MFVLPRCRGPAGAVQPRERADPAARPEVQVRRAPHTHTYVHTCMHRCMAKTYLNAWTTSQRFHEGEVLRCVLGCPVGVDCLQHYFQCPVLWGIVASVCGEVPDALLSRIALERPGRASQMALTVAFTLYHALKISERDLVDRAQGSRDFSGVGRAAFAHAGNAAGNLGCLVAPRGS